VIRLRRPLVISILFVFGHALPGRADVGVLIMEPIKSVGYLLRAGHAATYLSNICPDGSPVRMRLCRPGEHGSVISKYTPISENTDYDWAIVPFDQFLNGFESPALAPLIATARLHEAIEAHDFEPLFSHAILRLDDGSLPDGDWKTTLATRFDRTIYNFSISTTPAEDQRIVDVLNRGSNTSHFNFFYDNCSNQAKELFAIVLPGTEFGDRTSGLTMETPKGVAKALVGFARAHPERQLRVERYVQTPGAGPRSRETLFPLENLYRNPTFAPYWFFEGFREVALGALVYHQVVARFSVERAFDRWSTPHRAGTKTEWRAYERELQTSARAVATRVPWPADVAAVLASPAPSGRLARPLLEEFEADGQFAIDDGRGAWMTLRLGDVDESTGVSEAEVTEGDARLAYLVLAAAIDYNLAAPDDRRTTPAAMDRLIALLRETELRLAHGAASRRSG